jgi:hypothetical protein
MEVHRLRAFEKMFLRRMFVLKKDEERQTGEYCINFERQCYKFDSSPNFNAMMK